VDRLYTPWRREYVTSLDTPSGCILCRIQQQGDEEAGILAREAHWFVVLNKYPYTTGHLMVVTRRHAGSLDELTLDEQRAYPALLRRAEAALRAAYNPQGMNIGLNLGRSAGAGVHGHVHWHMLPRWGGDTNFVTVVGDTRVLPETLPETYRRLQPLFAQGSAP
jgi:ATP adenylyltransferase